MVFMVGSHFQHLDPEADFGPIRDHFRKCFRESYSDFLEDPALQYLLNGLDSEDLGGLVPVADENVILVHCESEIVGSVVWVKRSNIVYIWGLYVCRMHQRKKLGTYLIKDIIRQQKTSVALELTVLRVSLDAVSFYQNVGFSPVSETKVQLAPQQDFSAILMKAQSNEIAQTLSMSTM